MLTAYRIYSSQGHRLILAAETLEDAMRIANQRWRETWVKAVAQTGRPCGERELAEHHASVSALGMTFAPPWRRAFG